LAFVADDAALQLVVGQRKGGDAALRAPLRSGALDGQRDDLACFHLRMALRLLTGLADHLGGLEPHLLAHVAQEHLAGVLHREAGDLLELHVELLAEPAQPITVARRLRLRPLQIALAAFEILLAALEVRVPFAQAGLAFLHEALRLLAVARLAAQVLLEARLGLEPFLPGLQEGLSLLMLRLAAALPDDVLGFVPGPVDFATTQAALEVPP